MPRAILLAALGAAAASSAGGSSSALSAGDWGGVGAAMNVDAPSGNARVELDCAHGSVEGPLSLDAEGRFDRPGTLTFEGPGPARQGREPEPIRVRYRGRLTDGVLTLEILREDGGPSPAPFALEHGRPARLRKCG